MTYEQTREQFLLAWNSNAYLNMCESEDMKNAIEALEKQIPKKPKTEPFYGGRCIVCNALIANKSVNYCHECGHKLDWGD